MPDLNEVYRKFGEVAEAAQLLETELGNLLLWEKGMEADLLFKPDPVLAKDIYGKLNRLTTGQLLKELKKFEKSLENLEADIRKALDERNKLFHSFYRKHNFRRNSSEGCQIMLDELEEMHDTILDAYMKLLQLSGFDLSDTDRHKLSQALPTQHLNI